MSNVLDAVQIAFYSLGSLALLVGGVIGVRRFAVERPHYTAWEATYSETTLREALIDNTPVFLHSLVIACTNRSHSFQKFEGYWLQIFPDNDADFDGQRFARTPASVEGFGQFFRTDMTRAPQNVPPNVAIRFGQTMRDERPHSAVRVCYAAFARRPRLFLPGFHKDLRLVAVGSQIVFVRMEDLRHFGASGPTNT